GGTGSSWASWPRSGGRNLDPTLDAQALFGAVERLTRPTPEDPDAIDPPPECAIRGGAPGPREVPRSRGAVRAWFAELRQQLGGPRGHPGDDGPPPARGNHVPAAAAFRGMAPERDEVLTPTQAPRRAAALEPVLA
ncbi:MAG: hypothetical protein JWO90_2742, partial [Solirubrobacterales bacterium]|nr:hypothetical protein [Solirubrobacterales bacterium]